MIDKGGKYAVYYQRTIWQIHEMLTINIIIASSAK